MDTMLLDNPFKKMTLAEKENLDAYYKALMNITAPCYPKGAEIYRMSYKVEDKNAISFIDNLIELAEE